MKLARLRIHLLTAIIMQIVLCVLIWANVRARPFDVSQNSQYRIFFANPFSEIVEYGWPFTAVVRELPFTFLDRDGNVIEPVQHHSNFNWLHRSLAIDLSIQFTILLLTWLACERFLYRPKPKTTNPKPQT
jgi:hypothetical protein